MAEWESGIEEDKQEDGGMRAEECPRFTDRPFRLLRGKNNAVHVQKSKTHRGKRSGSTGGQKQKSIVWRSRIGRKKRKRKNNMSAATTTTAAAAVRSRPAVCSSRKGRRWFFIQQCVRRRLISSTYCQVEIRPTCKHI